MGTLLDTFRSHHSAAQEEELSLDEYLDLCRTDPRVYATAAERMLAGIGEAELVDTRNDPRLSRLFGNRVIRRYPAFREFYGMEDAIEQIVAFFKHAAQGLEEKKQILYLLGPVGGGKSSIAERLKSVMELNPIYVLKGSPVNESPLGLFPPERYAQILQDEYGIPRRYLTGIVSPWAIKRLQEFDGDIGQFKVVRVTPSVLRQIAITKTEPGDENNQDISSLVGKIDIRKLEHFAQNDPDAYSYSGGLCLANQGLLEFVEMFKAPIKMLHPLLTATQEGNFKGAEGFSAIPFNGLVVAHSNESEWHSFRNNRHNEAFLDCIHIIEVPLRLAKKAKTYDKLPSNKTRSIVAGEQLRVAVPKRGPKKPRGAVPRPTHDGHPTMRMARQTNRLTTSTRVTKHQVSQSPKAIEALGKAREGVARILFGGSTLFVLAIAYVFALFLEVRGAENLLVVISSGIAFELGRNLTSSKRR